MVAEELASISPYAKSGIEKHAQHQVSLCATNTIPPEFHQRRNKGKKARDALSLLVSMKTRS